MSSVTINKAEEKMIQNGDAKGAFESMLTRFNRLVGASGIFRELKECQYYEKPSDKKRRKHREALARMRKEQKSAIHKRGTTRPSGTRNTSTRG